MKIYHCTLKSGITRSQEFEKKRLATHAVNIGVKCGHGCQYCSSGAMLRMHPAFKEHAVNPFKHGYAIIDPDTPIRVASDARKITKRGMVQLCTTVDAWAPEAQELQLGRKCLEAILSEPGWEVRILTKNDAVYYDFDVISEYRDRILIGLSVTATPDKQGVIDQIEPNASALTDRMFVLKEAAKLGFRTYAMFCPLLPEIADSPEQIEALIQFAVECNVEEIFVEPVNARGSALSQCQNILSEAGYRNEASAIEHIRCQANWSKYVLSLVRNVQASVRKYADISKLRFLLYPSRLKPDDIKIFEQDDAGIIWLN